MQFIESNGKVHFLVWISIKCYRRMYVPKWRISEYRLNVTVECTSPSGALVTKAFSVIDVSLQVNHSTIKSICHILLNDTPKPACIKDFSGSRLKNTSKTAKNMPFCRLLNDKKIERQTFTSTSLSEIIGCCLLFN